MDRPAGARIRPISAKRLLDLLGQIAGFVQNIANQPEVMSLTDLVMRDNIARFTTWAKNTRKVKGQPEYEAAVCVEDTGTARQNELRQVRGLQVEAARVRIVYASQIPSVLHHHVAPQRNRPSDRPGLCRSQGHRVDDEVSAARKRQGSARQIERCCLVSGTRVKIGRERTRPIVLHATDFEFFIEAARSISGLSELTG